MQPLMPRLKGNNSLFPFFRHREPLEAENRLVPRTSTALPAPPGPRPAVSQMGTAEYFSAELIHEAIKLAALLTIHQLGF